MSEERIRILQMMQDQTLTAAEGAELLSALGAVPEQPTKPTAPTTPAPWRWFRIQVTDAATGREKVQMRMPFGLLEFGLKVGGVAGLDLSELRSAFADIENGSILEVDDKEGGEHVQIFLE